MKKLLFITTRLFWPTDSGRKLSLYYYCKGLHEHYNYEVYIYSFLETGQSEKNLADKPEFIKEVRLAKSVSGFTKMFNLATKSLFCGVPFQNSLFYSKKNKSAIKEYCKELNPDAIIVDMVRLAPYYKAIESFNCKKILDLDDLLSKRYIRQVESKDKNSQVLGAFASKSAGNKDKALSLWFIKKGILKSESKRVKRTELKYGKLYDSVIFVSQKETAEFNQLIGEEKAFTVSVGVDVGYYAASPDVKKERGTIAFLGNLKYSPNVASLDLIVNEILPKVNFDYKLYIIGIAPDEVISKYQNDNIIFCGRVDDLRTRINKCEMFLAPIPYGTGIKTKILEAMAMGIPVVTNTVGAEGLEVVDGQEMFIKDTSDEIAVTVNMLLNNSELCLQVGKCGQAFAVTNHDWNKIYEIFGRMGL